MALKPLTLDAIAKLDEGRVRRHRRIGDLMDTLPSDTLDRVVALVDSSRKPSIQYHPGRPRHVLVEVGGKETWVELDPPLRNATAYGIEDLAVYLEAVNDEAELCRGWADAAYRARAG